MDHLAQQQLGAIASLLVEAGKADVRLWLRGGWAMDFFLGQVTRPHQDVDWFVLVEDVPAIRALLLDDGFQSIGTSPEEQQLDFTLGEVEHGFSIVALNPEGDPVVAGGEWAGSPWPKDLLAPCVGELAGIRAPIVPPEVQIELKESLPDWNPTLRRRTKDAEDVALLRASL